MCFDPVEGRKKSLTDVTLPFGEDAVHPSVSRPSIEENSMSRAKEKSGESE